MELRQKVKGCHDRSHAMSWPSLGGGPQDGWPTLKEQGEDEESCCAVVKQLKVVLITRTGLEAGLVHLKMLRPHHGRWSAWSSDLLP